jgi:hypothetical protein
VIDYLIKTFNIEELQKESTRIAKNHKDSQDAVSE